MEKRYYNLLPSILKRKRITISEVGVYNGRRALEMIKAAKIYNDKIEYFGFDLFDDFEKNILKKEHSKQSSSLANIKKLLSTFGKIKLFKEFSQKPQHSFIKK